MTVCDLGVPTHYWHVCEHPKLEGMYIVCHNSNGGGCKIDAKGVTHPALGTSGIELNDALKIAQSLNETWNAGLVEAGNFAMRMLGSMDANLW